MCCAGSDQLFNLKFTSKTLVRNSKKSEKNEKAQKSKLKQAIEKGNMEGARIYAQNAIREKNQALNYLRLSSRVDAVAARVETAVRMGDLTKSMSGVVKGMDKVLKTMDVEKISKTMESFEKQFENMDVRSAYMEGAIGNSTAGTTPADEVDTLMKMVAEENGLELGGMLDEAGVVSAKDPGVATTEQPAGNDLAARLAALQNK